jgi:NhaA family Na+:H+ antiporter
VSPRPFSALRQFLRSESGGGAVLIGAAALALLAANLPATATAYADLLHAATGPVLSPALGPMTVHLWINDALMALFFLLVGCEIKRELVDGQLAKPSRRRLPFVAAAAGMAVPAAIYLLVAGRTPGLARGWAIPAATDIAFAVGVLAMLGSRVPLALRVFLTAVAIVDDMGAAAIIAVAYTRAIDWGALAAAAGVLATMAALNRHGERRLWPYLLGFALLWWLVLLSGVHATVAGVLAAACVPVTRSPGAPDAARSPLHRLEHLLNPGVAYLVVPLFAFANAGLSLAGLGPGSLADPLVIGVAAGLVLGKPAGLLGAIALAERSGFARRPAGASWRMLTGVACLAGIGFTMSLFIGGLAFADPGRLAAVKLGVLAGSLLSALAGVALLWSLPYRRR